MHLQINSSATVYRNFHKERAGEILRVLGAIERVVPLLVAVLTAVMPLMLAILSNSKKQREQEKEHSDRLCGVMEQLKSSFERVEVKVNTLENHLRENYRRILMMEIMEENLPMEERLKAGEAYVKEGWNGAVKTLYLTLQEEYQESLKERG